MIFKAFIVAAAILNGVSAEGQYPKNTERQLSNASTRPKNHSALTLQGFLSFLDDDATNLRGQGKHRRLERIVGTEGESMTKHEVKEAIQRAIDPPNGGRGAYENCEQLFNAFDKNKDGYLTKSEMADLFSSLTGCSRSFGLQLAQGMLDWYDSSGDDKLNPAELEAACKGGKLNLILDHRNSISLTHTRLSYVFCILTSIHLTRPHILIFTLKIPIL